MIATNSYSLRKEYANIWYEEETKCLPQLKQGKKIITVLVRCRLFVLAQFYHYGVRLFERLKS